MKITALTPLISAAVFFISCKGNVDISGKYIKAKGDYRYSAIVFEKINGAKYGISGFDGETKKFRTTGELEEREINMGWMSKLTFREDYRQFYLHSGKGSVFVKEETGKR